MGNHFMVFCIFGDPDVPINPGHRPMNSCSLRHKSIFHGFQTAASRFMQDYAVGGSFPPLPPFDPLASFSGPLTRMLPISGFWIYPGGRLESPTRCRELPLELRFGQIRVEPPDRKIPPVVDMNFEPRAEDELGISGERIMVVDGNRKREAGGCCCWVTPSIYGHLGKKLLDVNAAIALGAPGDGCVPIDVNERVWRYLDQFLLPQPPAANIRSVFDSHGINASP